MRAAKNSAKAGRSPVHLALAYKKFRRELALPPTRVWAALGLVAALLVACIGIGAWPIYRDDMFAASDTPWAPWFVAHSNDKKRAQLNIIAHILSRIPYHAIKRDKVKLPKRHVTAEPTVDYPFKYVPEKY